MSMISNPPPRGNPLWSKRLQEQSRDDVKNLLEEWFFDSEQMAIGRIDGQPSITLKFTSGLKIEMWVGLNWQIRISKVDPESESSEAPPAYYKLIVLPSDTQFATVPGIVVSEFAQLYNRVLAAEDGKDFTGGMGFDFYMEQFELIESFQDYWSQRYRVLRNRELEKAKSLDRGELASQGFGWLMIFGMAIVVLTVAGALFS